MSIEVSVVMISYNKYPQNLISLYAIENQTFDLQKLEVIFVDDASTDETTKLKKLKHPFKFTYIRCDTNKGRSEAKNIGVQASSGKILIIMDSEMILDPEYVSEHVQQHNADEKLVVTSCYNHYDTFTVLESKFNKIQMSKINQLLDNDKFRNIPVKEIMKKNKKTQLFSKKDILRGEYKRHAYHSSFFRKVYRKYGSSYTGFFMPYIFVITHCISLRRSTFDLAGPFYNGFIGWGCEDWEFGYRLQQQGVKIMDYPNVKVYHQEHLRSLADQSRDRLVNYYIFFRLHPKFDVGVQALCWIGKNLLEANDLIIEYNSMVRQHGHLTYVEQAFIYMFESILTLLIERKPVEQLLQHSGLFHNEIWMNQFSDEMNVLSTEYPELHATLKMLIDK